MRIFPCLLLRFITMARKFTPEEAATMVHEMSSDCCMSELTGNEDTEQDDQENQDFVNNVIESEGATCVIARKCA